MKLNILIKAISQLSPEIVISGRRIPIDHTPDADIASIHCNSREVATGGLFVAMKGVKADGHRFIADAASRGAAAIVVQDAVPADSADIIIRVTDTRKALALLADAIYRHPSKGMTVIGITGTNGKTTTTFIIESMLKQAGFSVGVIGTVNYRYNGKSFDNPVTTPESLDMTRILHEMKNEGVTHAVIEVSSHAVDYHRAFATSFDIGIFTNLSQDHLDHHLTMETYWASKKRFFTHLLMAEPKGGHAKAVINVIDEHGKGLWDEKCVPGINVGFSKDCTVHAEGLAFSLNGIDGNIVIDGKALPFHSALVGRHNAENILCGAGAGFLLGLSPEAIVKGIENLPFVPGRLEPVPNDKGFFIYVDYAHTPDALINVLSALKDLPRNRIITVFGCGGDRDRAKRPKMGRAVGRYSDLAVLTSDNPRSEDPMFIISEAVPGIQELMPLKEKAMSFNGDETGFMVEADRRSAIGIAIRSAKTGDAVLIAGKGHENYQIVGDKRLVFDDKEEALKILAGL